MTDNRTMSPASQIAAEPSVEPRDLIEQLAVMLADAQRVESEALRSEALQSEALHLLSRLAHVLAERFAREEQDGSHDEALARAPWLSGAVRQLRQEHERLLQALEGMTFALKSGHATSLCRDLEQRVAAFVEMVCDHEAAELNLLQDSCEQPAWTLE